MDHGKTFMHDKKNLGFILGNDWQSPPILKKYHHKFRPGKFHQFPVKLELWNFA